MEDAVDSIYNDWDTLYTTVKIYTLRTERAFFILCFAGTWKRYIYRQLRAFGTIYNEKIPFLFLIQKIDGEKKVFLFFEYIFFFFLNLLLLSKVQCVSAMTVFGEGISTLVRVFFSSQFLLIKACCFCIIDVKGSGCIYYLLDVQKCTFLILLKVWKLLHSSGSSNSVLFDMYFCVRFWPCLHYKCMEFGTCSHHLFPLPQKGGSFWHI